MQNGDLEKQPESLDTLTTAADAVSANADPVATEPAATERLVNSLESVVKESLWQRLRNQPRETAAIVVLVVTAIIWLDSGDSKSPKDKTSKSLDPMDGFESYLSDFDTEESNTPLRESADPLDTQSPASFSSDLTIPKTQQSDFASAVTANYGDTVFETGNSLSELEKHITQILNLQDQLTADSSEQSADTEKAFQVFIGSIAETEMSVECLKQSEKSIAVLTATFGNLLLAVEQFKLTQPASETNFPLEGMSNFPETYEENSPI